MALELLPIDTVAAAACEVEYFVKAISNEHFPLGLNWGSTQVVVADLVNEFIRQAEMDLLIIVARDSGTVASASSFLLTEFIRIRHLLLRAATCPVRMVMETALADDSVIHGISGLLGCIPHRIESDAVSAFHGE